MKQRFEEKFLSALKVFTAIDATLAESGIVAKERNEEGESFPDHIFAETPRVHLVWTLDGRTDPNTVFAELQYAYHAVLSEPGVIELTVFFDPARGEKGGWSYRLRDPSAGKLSPEIAALVLERGLEPTPAGSRRPIEFETGITLVREIGRIAASIADREASRAVGA